MELPLPCRSWFSPFMIGCIYSLIIITLLSCSVLGANRIPGNETERLALLEFKDFLSDPLGVLNSWNTTIHFYQWYGVTCGRRHRRVTALKLRSKDLRGIISPRIGNLTFLRVLDLQNNSFHSRIPPEVGHLYRLQGLHLNNNSLDGPIPPSLSRCFNLVILKVQVNMLEGNLPAELSSLSKLKALILDKNGLIGPIPSSYGNLSSLESLYTTLNELDGMIPDTLGSLQNLNFLGLGGNNFVGTIPTSIFIISSLEVLDVTNNQLVGSLPSDLGFTLPALQFLFFAMNHFTGPIPKSLSNLSDLSVFSIDQNNFTGKLPSFQKMNELRFVGIASNHLGEIPHTMGNLSMLTHLSLRSNRLQGAIPSSLSKCRSLLLLNLGDNKLSGAIPPEIMEISSLSIRADFSSNNLIGELPLEVGNLKNLGALYLQDNRISGEIPGSLGSCIMMENLYMQDNLFEGSIPSTLSNLKGIQELNLSNNMLSGQIPKFLGDLNLTSLVLALNEFEGAVPTGGVFKNASATSLIGNKDLCGGLAEFRLPKCNIEEPRRVGTMNSARIIIISSVSSLLGLLLILVLLYILWCRRQSKTTMSKFSRDGLLKVSYQSLLKATNGFSSINLIGSGSFGSVFRGVFDWNQTVVAVKVLNLVQYGAATSFISECEALRNIRHRNLVKCDVPIVHCDIKPSNVLLDDEMTAHVGDFGLVRFLPKATRESVADPSSSIGVKGSLGYIAPEYGAGGDVSTHGDVYSFGILVLEMFMGKRPTDKMFTNGLNLHSFANTALPEQISQVVDPFLLQEYRGMESSWNNVRSGRHRNRFQKIQECLVSIIRQGVVCSSECPVDRMNVADVAAALRVIQKELLQVVNQ
ncbi:hypothetical protein CRG98_048395 [Punica granatum]|uniref:non-specific serine/threonine protein kinase n=1 Tax=Punica granatum TaxID=22663 RepID=A0A2I0HHQ1_PUNGR|nr:hypothetical protein CRG98_048395 [Punica granatum]